MDSCGQLLCKIYIDPFVADSESPVGKPDLKNYGFSSLHSNDRFYPYNNIKNRKERAVCFKI